MTIDEIKELIRVVQDTGIAELEVKRGENSVRIRNSIAAAQEYTTSTSLPTTGAAVPLTQPGTAVPDHEEEHLIAVKSPIVGTYYDAATPGAPPFVKVGDRVEPRQVLCIIESMKLMNEIESEVAGTVVAKLVENNRPVEYGESLFSIRPV